MESRESCALARIASHLVSLLALLMPLTCLSSLVFGQNRGSIRLESHLPFPVEKIRDVWGYVDSTSGREYALVGYRNKPDRGIFIVDVTDPQKPALAATINPTPSFDIKTFKHYAYAVYGTATPPATIINIEDPENPEVVGSFPSSHNLFITPNGYMLLEEPGLRIFDLNEDPTNPTKIWDDQDPAQDGHDAAVIGDRLYDFHGHSGTKIFDVREIDSPRLLGLIQDPAIAFHHSGWVSEDQDYLFICDELATATGGPADITVWDIRNVANPTKVGEFVDSSATVHNLYIVGDYAFVSYYTSGFRVLDVSDPARPRVVDTYDTAPNKTGPDLKGAFGVYPFSPSGNIYVSDTQNGLFVFSFSESISIDTTKVSPAKPIVNAFSPQSGPVGTTVTIRGQNFVQVFEVRFGETVARTFSLETESEIRAVVPVGAGSGKIHVVTSEGVAESATSFVVIPDTATQEIRIEPSEDSFVWSKRPVTDYGNALALRVRETRKADQIAYMKFSLGELGERRIVNAKLQLYVLDGGNDGGSLFVVSNAFRDSEEPWLENSLNWTNAPKLTNKALGLFGPVVAGNYAELDVTDAVSGLGELSFAVKNNSSDVVKYGSKESTNPPALIVEVQSSSLRPEGPGIVSFTPTLGSVGTKVTIVGNNFDDVSQVIFGNGAASVFTIRSSSEIVAEVPETATSGKIRVVSPLGTTETATEFDVVPVASPPPVISSFNPTAGIAGTQVTVTGSHFSDVTSVTFNGVSANLVLDQNDSQVVVAVPDGAASGKITITTPHGAATSEEDFTVLDRNVSQVRTFIPTDDTFVWSKKRTNNYGAAEELRVRQTSHDQIIYLKFRVTDIIGPVEEAKLRLFVADGSDDGGAVHLVSNEYRGTSVSWTETGMDWSNAPVLVDRRSSPVGKVFSGETVEWDVTELVRKDSIYSFAILNQSRDVVKYSSKEGVTPPELVVVTVGDAEQSSVAHPVDVREDSSQNSDRLFASNYPNPFNIETTITYHLPLSTSVRLIIYNMKGQRVRTLVDEQQSVGRRVVRWDGRDDFGQVVGTGMYVYAIHAGRQSLFGKMILQK